MLPASRESGVLNAVGPSSGASDAVRPAGRLESRFDATFASTQALREKQIQQNYRPIIGIHKWFARRPGTLFRALLLAEYVDGPIGKAFWEGHPLRGTVADPFMGGGTILYEASRLGLSVLGNDINPMSHWLVARAFDPVDLDLFEETATAIAERVAKSVGAAYETRCDCCHRPSPVKYFLWVKTATCPGCNERVDVFPGRLLAKATRHPRHVLACANCGELNEYTSIPTSQAPEQCGACGEPVSVEGNSTRGTATCDKCDHQFSFPGQTDSPPSHRLWAIEYQCSHCYPDVKGRQFRKPDADDLARYESASAALKGAEGILDYIPNSGIPEGDETDRLIRWGYRHYREMFNHRQLLTLATLATEISAVEDDAVRNALLTVLSDILRYNNMLCRYDTYALKCQDIFSVHGFPVGLVQCENNVLGIADVGSGGFRHFVKKYIRARKYAERPFETRVQAGRKEQVFPPGEFIGEDLACNKTVVLSCGPSQGVSLQPNSLDGIFTDPPYFANVQYSELIDFCYVWLRQALSHNHPGFEENTTRSEHEATGNTTAGRGIEEFTKALSEVLVTFCAALKPGAPLVFTYHHNDPLAYLPLVVAVLDAAMVCTAVLPAAAEMAASLHIANTSSSVLDSVFVCRRAKPTGQASLTLWSTTEIADALMLDGVAMRAAGVKVGIGDLRCLLAGHVAKATMGQLVHTWDDSLPLHSRVRRVEAALRHAASRINMDIVVQTVLDRLEGTGATDHVQGQLPI